MLFKEPLYLIRLFINKFSLHLINCNKKSFVLNKPMILKDIIFLIIFWIISFSKIKKSLKLYCIQGMNNSFKVDSKEH